MAQIEFDSVSKVYGDGTQAVYALELTGSADRWRLVLTPKHAQLGRLFERIVIRGSQADIRTIELDQPDGDHSEMVITRSSLAR